MYKNKVFNFLKVGRVRGKMDRKKLEKIFEAISIIREFYNSENHEITAESLSEALNLGLDYRSLKKTSNLFGASVHGVLIKLPQETPKIIIEEELNEVQREFTIFHEIGHYLLHWGVNSKYSKKEKVEVALRSDFKYKDAADIDNEIECNIFATHIMFNYKNDLNKQGPDKEENEKSEVKSEIEKLYKNLYNRYTTAFFEGSSDLNGKI